jgi:DNA-binding MarR family transcriptional regulator
MAAHLSQADANYPVVCALLKTTKRLRALLVLHLARLGLSIGEDEVLLALRTMQVTSTIHLATSLSVSSSTMQRVIDRLIAKGCIEAVTGTIIRLTPAGEQMQYLVQRAYGEIETTIAGSSDPKKFKAILKQLQSVDDKLRRSLMRTDGVRPITIRIVYASHAIPEIGQAEIDNIVATAAEHNSRYGITGVLAFDGFQIIQVLEGNAEQVEALYRRIIADKRHEGVVTLLHERIEERRFSEWSMVRLPIAQVLVLVEEIRAEAI